MKETIYTIPLNESYEQDSECPLCFIEKGLEKEAVEYALGAAMMEPDYRIVSNDKGYCNKHFSRMFAIPNKLSLALVLDTHMNEIIKKLKASEKVITKDGKGGLFKKSEGGQSEPVKKITSSCVVCDRVNETMKRYIEIFFYMWEKDEKFREKVLSSKGFCLEHFSALVEGAAKNLKNPAEFVRKIYDMEIENLTRINEDVHKFTLKFDYRNKDMEWGTAEDAPIRAIEKIQGYINT